MLIFKDNTLVVATRANEYLGIIVSIRNPISAPVAVYRYTVPGRCDTYLFDWIPSQGGGIGDRLRFFSDQDVTLAEAAKMLMRDLNRPRVAQMIREAVESGWYAARMVDRLLTIIGGSTKSHRVARAAMRVHELNRNRKIANEKRNRTNL